MREAIAVGRDSGALEVGLFEHDTLASGDGERFGKGAESAVGDVDGAERETREGSLGEGLDRLWSNSRRSRTEKPATESGRTAMSWEARCDSSRASHHEGGRRRRS